MNAGKKLPSLRTVTSSSLNESLSVSRVFNASDKDFDSTTGGPHCLFINARIYITIKNNGGKTQWSCDDPNISIVSDSKGIACMVNVTGTLLSRMITINFSNSSGEGKYEIKCDLYVNNINTTFVATESPAASDYISLLDEWGDLTQFGWYRYYIYLEPSYFLYMDLTNGDVYSSDANPAQLHASTKVKW